MANGVNNKAFDLMTTAADKTNVDINLLGAYHTAIQHIIEAQSIHQDWKEWSERNPAINMPGSGDLAYHVKLIEEKNVAINALVGKGNYSDARDLINKWKKTHIDAKEWINEYLEEWTKHGGEYYGGDIKHQDKWIQNYNDALLELERIEKIYK